MIRILHITPHMGGGVGRVLRNYIGYSRSHERYAHRLLCLEHANPRSVEWASCQQIPLFSSASENRALVSREITDADVVLVHWWNHPLLMALLVREDWPPARVVLWSHVAGQSPPQVFSRPLIEFADRFVLATPYSRQTPVLQAWRGDPKRIQVVFSCAGIDHVRDIQPLQHDRFRVGYIGTVDACKLHPAFLQMSAAARIPDVEFVLCGGDRHLELRELARRMGLGDRFQFLGPVEDIRPHLASFDLFGYPLQRQHYGTGEQVLIEAMAAGVPAVVLGPGAESHVVQNGVDGVVVNSPEEYSLALESLWRDTARRKHLGANARQSAQAKYTIERTALSWTAEFDDLLGESKQARKWSGRHAGDGVTSAQVFRESLGDHSTCFDESLRGESRGAQAELEIARLPYLFRTPTRGTPFHYRRFFPEDENLRRWCRLLSNDTGEGLAGWHVPNVVKYRVNQKQGVESQ